MTDAITANKLNINQNSHHHECHEYHVQSFTFPQKQCISAFLTFSSRSNSNTLSSALRVCNITGILCFTPT